MAKILKMQEFRDRDEQAPAYSFLKPVTPWPTAIGIEQVLNDALDQFNKFTFASHETHIAASLWACSTWFLDLCSVFPMAMLTSLEAGCGKTTMLEVLGQMVKKPYQCGGASPAAIYTIMEFRPTLLIDEVDRFLASDEGLTQVLNLGHSKTGVILKVEMAGKNRSVREFPCYGAKALCGINATNLTETLVSRSIVLELARKPLGHKLHDFYALDEDENLEHRQELDSISMKLQRVSSDLSENFMTARPALPDWLQNRNRQNWQPLLRLALLAGEEWYTEALSACEKLTARGKKISANENLLLSIKRAFDETNSNFMSSADLICELCSDEFEPWLDWNRGKPINARQVSQRLKGHDIEPCRNQQQTARGYYREHFQKAWESYCA